MNVVIRTTMRNVIDPQLKLGEEEIAAIVLDLRSRDDIPQLLRGLQHISTTPQVREPVFAILAELRPPGSGADGKASPETGRPGLSPWAILVLGVLRLGLNADYDRILELANQHTTLRKMLGHTDWADDTTYTLQTLKDNVSLFTPELLDRINQAVVGAGHALVKKSPDDSLAVRCDACVVETHVHDPTDINLLLDAVRKAIETSAGLCEDAGLSDWRQSAYNVRCLKKAYRRAQTLKHSTAQDPDKRAARRVEIQAAHAAYLDLAEGFLMRARETRIRLHLIAALPHVQLAPLAAFIAHGERQIDRIRRRVLCGQTIPHAEKVFSIFQPHTEWISQGKTGVPVELGLRVAIGEDQNGFILHHRVMERITDDQVAVALAEEIVARFPTLASASMDKGFHSPANQRALAEVIDFPVLPKKGTCSAAEREREGDPRFIHRRRKHSAVASAINALELHGLDRCRDHGIDGFKRYVALAVVARNLQRIGALLLAQEAEEARRARDRQRRRRAA